MADIGSFGINFNNTTSAIQPVSALGFPVTPQDTLNNFILQSWNISTFTFSGGEDTVSILYRTKPETYFSQFTSSLASQTFQAIADALNQLGIGHFFIRTAGAQTFLSTINSNIVYSYLDIFQNSPLPKLAFRFRSNYAGNPNPADKFIEIIKNGITVVTISFPTNVSGTLLAFNVGDSISFIAQYKNPDKQIFAGAYINSVYQIPTASEYLNGNPADGFIKYQADFVGQPNTYYTTFFSNP